jgi:hypothetical protein
VLGESFRRFRNDPRLVVLPQLAKPLGIGAAMIAYVVATLLDALDHIGIVLAHKTVEQDSRR